MYILAPFLGPSLGPLVGAYIVAEYKNDWKYSIWVILFICAPVGVATLFMQETSKKRILELRERKSGGGRNREKVMGRFWEVMMRPLHMCLFEVCCVTFSAFIDGVVR